MTDLNTHTDPPAQSTLLVRGLKFKETLTEYERRGGYAALRKTLEWNDPARVIACLTASGLRGRGGANFPTHRKWEMVLQQPEHTRYVVCNGGEHEPGSLKDRALMTYYPHAVLEGLLIAAHTLDATAAYIYITEDQTEAMQSMARAIDELKSLRLHGLLAEDFKLICVPGPPTYIAGEETAVLNAIEGREAKPRQKPPYPTVSGLFDAPTLVNNVETLAMVAPSVMNGSDGQSDSESRQRLATLLITLSNGVNRPGVYEVPYGITLRNIIDTCGGGTIGGKPVKAILPGGPSLPFLTGDQLDMPFNQESMAAVGSGVGCGAIRIWLEGECMVEPVLEIAKFFSSAQCGQCPPCRMETSSFVAALQHIQDGTGSRNHLLQMSKVAEFAKSKGGRCSLIPMAAAPVLSAMRLFESDFQAHINQHSCSAA